MLFALAGLVSLKKIELLKNDQNATKLEKVFSL